MSRKRRYFCWLAAPLLLLSACGTKNTKLACDVSYAQSEPANLAVNIFIDGTPSMGGFTSSSQGEYAKTIEALRTMITLDEPVTIDGERGGFARDPLYFRLGKNGAQGGQTQALTESEFREAAFADFYDGSSGKFPLLTVAELDVAIAPISDGDGLTAIVTDLYQGENDIQKVTQAIKDVLSESPEQAIGLLGIKGDFNGTVYTEALRNTSSFTHDGPHPFYVLFIGRVDDVQFYVSNLVEKLGGGVETQATIFSTSRFYAQPVTINKKEQSDLLETVEDASARKSLSVPAAAMKAGDTVATFEDSNIQPLSFRASAADQVSLPSRSSLDPIPYVLPLLGIDANTTAATSRGAEPFSDSAGSNILTLEETTVAGDSLQFNAQFDVAALPKSEIQFVEASLIPEGGVSSEQWWSDWNSAAGENDGTRTDNLEEFAKQLRATTNARIAQTLPTVGKLCYAIEKR